jgi:hypothetical protein
MAFPRVAASAVSVSDGRPSRLGHGRILAAALALWSALAAGLPGQETAPGARHSFQDALLEKLVGDAIEFELHDLDGPFFNTFSWDARSGGTSRLENVDRDGHRSLFAVDSYRRP